MKTIYEEAQILTDKLVSNYKPLKVILFGSVAKGKAHANSDIDLFIIKNSTKKRPLRIKEVFEALRGIQRNYPLDPIVYTPNEVEKRLALGDYFVKKVFQEGQVLHG